MDCIKLIAITVFTLTAALFISIIYYIIIYVLFLFSCYQNKNEVNQAKFERMFKVQLHLIAVWVSGEQY